MKGISCPPPPFRLRRGKQGIGYKVWGSEVQRFRGSEVQRFRVIRLRIADFF